MEGEIINRVASSPLVTIDLDALLPQKEVVELDISQWLDGGILREKNFREHIKTHAWEVYSGEWVNIRCSEDAIIPLWAWMLVSSALSGYAEGIISCEQKDSWEEVVLERINRLPLAEYQDKPLVVKGCSSRELSPRVYTKIVEKLQPIARSILFGEACSTVPIYKKPKK